MYDYATMQMDLEAINGMYPFIQIETIGQSVECRDIYLLKLGQGEKKIFYNGSHHGQEWITSWLLMRFIFDYADALVYDRGMAGRSISAIFNEYTLYIVPMVNPDGIEKGKTEPDWQANASGVDLNHNYNAKWQEGKDYIAENCGVTEPGPRLYSGPYPESEPETRAIARLTESQDFLYVVAYHSQGEVIYWKFGDHIPQGGEEIARYFSQVSGYELDETVGSADFSGYKDWFVQQYDRPGFTIEVGEGTNPLPEEMFEQIYDDVLEILLPYRYN